MTPAAAPNLKEVAIDFLQLVASGKVREAFRKHVAPDFRHHNAYFKGDAQSLMRAMEENAEKNPNKILEVQRALQDDDCVAVHSRVRMNPQHLGIAVVHIFRFHGILITEMWDIGQPVPENCPNENGMF